MSIGGAGLSVILPAVNEHDTLPALIRALTGQRDLDLECIVADGGSDDGTAACARACGARVIASALGRGRQMNAGARAARGEWLLFLHADSQLSAARQLRTALDALIAEKRRDDGILAGHFALRFARRDDAHARLFRFLEAKSASNRPYSINGDQGLLIHRRDFDALGGFDEALPFFEDQRIAARIFERGRWILLPGTLITSARRFEAEGHAERYTLMALMMGLHYAGLHEFFREAPRLYVAQRDAQRLDPLAFRGLVLQILRQRGWRATALTAWRCGRLARENAWQLALLRDLARAGCAQHGLHRFDRYVAPLLGNPAADGIAGLLVAFWFLVWLPLQCGLYVERGKKLLGR